MLNAGPAQFGIDLGKSGMGVGAEVVLADPFKGCTELKNKEAADHRIVIMERGDCMFIDKVSGRMRSFNRDGRLQKVIFQPGMYGQKCLSCKKSVDILQQTRYQQADITYPDAFTWFATAS